MTTKHTTTYNKALLTPNMQHITLPDISSNQCYF